MACVDGGNVVVVVATVECRYVAVDGHRSVLATRLNKKVAKHTAGIEPSGAYIDIYPIVAAYYTYGRTFGGSLEVEPYGTIFCDGKVDITAHIGYGAGVATCGLDFAS